MYFFFNCETNVMLLVLMAVTVLTSLSLFVFTAVAVWKLDTLITGLLLFVVVLVTLVDGELGISEVSFGVVQVILSSFI